MAIPFLQQASDWLAPLEANINKNNSLLAPIRGFNFLGGVFWDNGIVTLYTLNIQSRSASKEKIENGSSYYSLLIVKLLFPESMKKGDDKCWTKLGLNHFSIFYVVTPQLDKKWDKSGIPIAYLSP